MDTIDLGQNNKLLNQEIKRRVVEYPLNMPNGVDIFTDAITNGDNSGWVGMTNTGSRYHTFIWTFPNGPGSNLLPVQMELDATITARAGTTGAISGGKFYLQESGTNTFLPCSSPVCATKISSNTINACVGNFAFFDKWNNGSTMIPKLPLTLMFDVFAYGPYSSYIGIKDTSVVRFVYNKEV